MEVHAKEEFENTPCISLSCKLVPVHYREYENGLLAALEDDSTCLVDHSFSYKEIQFEKFCPSIKPVLVK